ncbi:MAG: GuaB3 family IMP dehydrogenase-related protein [Spirochaetota bacterium]|nr:GuaB3 family IMP dehydrogenase-related protein [Spirochaetota bacterium]
MGIWIGRGRKARQTYGFDDVALVPGNVTIDPEDVDVTWRIGNIEVDIPIIASAMDGVVDTKFAIEMGKLGGLAVLNLEGLQCKYDNPEEQLKKIVAAPKETVTNILQEIYQEPVKDKLVVKRIEEIKSAGVKAAVSATPPNAERFGDIAREAKVDVFVVQSTVTTVQHLSSQYKTLDFTSFCKKMDMPIIVGNTVSYEASLELMETGIDGLLIGVGPGAACTTREVLGIGVPQITATCDAAAARDTYFKRTGRYVPIITDGGMRGGGDLCKAIAAGADAVMIGSAFAKADEAPGKGFHWGMATPSILLPRGTRIEVGIMGTLKEILLGPARYDDGSQNLVGALKNSMGSCGARNIREMQECEMIVAPSIRTEGKTHQRAQSVGMGK